MNIFGFKIGRYKDGGPDSNVTGYMVEHKRLATCGVLFFARGRHEVFHSHAFDCVSLILSGELVEEFIDGTSLVHGKGKVLVTRRRDLHRVTATKDTWVLTLRGLWLPRWYEVAISGRVVWLYTLVDRRMVTATRLYRSIDLLNSSLGLRLTALDDGRGV
jgi:hypothetical protein